MSTSHIPNSGSSLSADYCVVGAGMVGLVTARKILDNGGSVVLVDSGYHKYNQIAQDLNSGFSGPFGNWPLPNFAVSHQRIRGIGGTAMLWGGWCRELNDWDFTANNKCDISWPFPFDELKPFYQEARKALGINENAVAIDAPPSALAPLIPSIISCASETFRDDLLRSLRSEENFTLIPGFTLVGLPVDKNTVTTAVFRKTDRTDHDRGLTVTANRFIICGGGIENARILLTLLPKPNIDGLPIGLGFMEHPKVLVGQYYPTNKKVLNYLKSLAPPLTGRDLLFKSPLKRPFGELQLPPETQKAKGLGNAMIGFRQANIYAASLVKLRYNFLTRNLFSCGPIGPSRLISLARDCTRIISGRLAQQIGITRPCFSVFILFEQYPNDFNSVSLTDVKDAQNIPRVRLNWKMSEEDIHTVIGTLHEFKNIVNKNKIGRFVPEKQLIDSEKQMKYLEVEAHAEGHQMGTTRMGSSETSSVCDNTGKVWRTTNLFVFGASLFPRGGAANPGLTSVALALRNIKKIMHTHLV